MTARKHPAYPPAVLARHEKDRKANLAASAKRYREGVTAEFRKAVAIKAGFARGEDPDLSNLTGEQVVALLEAANWFSRQASEAVKLLLPARPLS